jgi:hypothetical protein
MNVALFLEIKNEYTEHLVDTVTPFIYEGLICIYKEAVKIAEEANSKEKILNTFQIMLRQVEKWNQVRITEETARIKQASGTADYLDDLIKAVIKSNIILLSYSNTISNIIAQTFYNNFATANFVHRCYIECAKDAFNNPFMFFHDVSPMEFKRNQILIDQMIRHAVERGLRKILPISSILKEYLINSVNIINEPQKIELVGAGQTADVNVNPLLAPVGLDPNAMPMPTAMPATNQLPKPLSEKPPLKLPETQLEKDVMKIIKSETKSDHDRVKKIMQIEKIITSMEPTRPADINSARSNRSELKIPPHLMEIELEDDKDIYHGHMNKSDRDLMNIDFEDQETDQGSTTKRSGSGTGTQTGSTISAGSQVNAPSRSKRGEMTESSIDPNKIGGYIEEYGRPNKGGAIRKSKISHRH